MDAAGGGGYNREPPSFPRGHMSDELIRLDAIGIVDRLKRGEVTPHDLLDALESRIAAVNGPVNALPTLCFDRARRHAARLMQRPVAERGQLAGMPTPGFFLDIGVPEAFERGQREIPAQRHRGALFLDRDGVLNVDHGYVGSIDRLEWIEGAEQAVRLANERDLYVFVVTNQAGVARGYYSEADVCTLHDHMQAHLNAFGAHIDEFRYSPYHVDGVVAEFVRDSECRKPRPGMIVDLFARWQVDPARSLLVGDKDSDLAAAAAAGIRGVKFEGGALDALVSRLI